MQLELDRQEMLVARQLRAASSSSRRRPTAIRRTPPSTAPRPRSNSAAANVDVLKGQEQEAISTLDELKTALAKAERDLSFTVIRAPLDGVIGNRAVQTGDYVQTGQRLASLVPLDAVYVDANFKETQLARLRPGQTVAISVDALPEHAIEGNDRKPLARLRRRVLAAAAGQRDRKLHQDRAAPAGAHPRAGRRRPCKACCAPACRWWSA